VVLATLPKFEKSVPTILLFHDSAVSMMSLSRDSVVFPVLKRRILGERAAVCENIFGQGSVA
jgi:hypothetical protein